MNVLSFENPFKQWRQRLMFHLRHVNVRTRTNSFSVQNDHGSIQRIYVINLDRKPDRWHQIRKELERIREWKGKPLTSISRRFSAIDARYLDTENLKGVLRPNYSLADQLSVEPNSKIRIDAESRARRIDMTPQEIAIALSHIEVWKLIASSNVPYTLVLEDDAYFCSGFCNKIDELWNAIARQTSEDVFDLLFLSFQEVGPVPQDRRPPNDLFHKPNRGVWQASGYVLSQSGAKKLIELLPAYGPIDLWLNLQFEKLNILIAKHPIIEQRIDVASTNSYSIMPVLSQIGVYTSEKPLVTQIKRLPGPIFAFGEQGSGLTALATGLSMLGYTCCSDLAKLTNQDHEILFSKSRGKIFNAYVNIGSINSDSVHELVKIYPEARFISTEKDCSLLPLYDSNRALYLPQRHPDKWAALSDFLGLDYPSFSYPSCADIGCQDVLAYSKPNENTLPSKQLKFDSSPWIVSSKGWEGIRLKEKILKSGYESKVVTMLTQYNELNQKFWKIRNDTFPSNLSVFTPNNVEVNESSITCLTLKRQSTLVRDFTSGAVVTRQSYLYGKFSVSLRPSNVSGLVTGIFLHRNGPHQEIDIEFLGKDTTKMLVNVFYNPGTEGTKLEYGYRGTPTITDIGFDASKEFHEYEIEWSPSCIRWLIDGKIVHERVLWDPTPIPNLPMEFNVNLWHSRSKKLSGKLDISRIPARSEIKSVYIKSETHRIYSSDEMSANRISNFSGGSEEIHRENLSTHP